MRYKINLLTEKKQSIIDQVVFFFLHYLRYIIVITQLIVIGVFFYRFRVDQNIIDLKESVEQKREIIQAVMPLLKQAAIIDKRTSDVKNILGMQSKFTSMLNYLTSSFPKEVYLDKLECDLNYFKMSGNTTDARVLQLFYAMIKKDNKFKTVDLQNIRKTDNGYSFILYLEGFKI